MRNEAMTGLVATHIPAATGAAGMVVLGVPQGVLIAAFLGAVLSFYFRQGEVENRIPWILFGVVSVAFAGAWFSLMLPHVDFMRVGAMAKNVDPSVRAGLCALAFQSVWNLTHRFANRKVEGR